jgi:hypothetical protein
MKMKHVFDLTAVLRRVRHSRMLLAGIQAESGLDPIETFGGDDFGSHLFAPATIFKGVHKRRNRVISRGHGTHRVISTEGRNLSSIPRIRSE